MFRLVEDLEINSFLIDDLAVDISGIEGFLTNIPVLIISMNEDFLTNDFTMVVYVNDSFTYNNRLFDASERIDFLLDGLVGSHWS